jgi:hypothetical protein
MSHDVPKHDPTDRFLLTTLDADSLRWAVVSGGFFLGILFGTILLFGQNDEPAQRSQVSARSETPVPRPSTSATGSTPSLATPGADDLAAERDRLRSEIEAAKLRHEVETLRRQLMEIESSPVSVETAPRRASDGRSSATNHTSNRPHTTSPTGSATAALATGDATLAYWNEMNAIILREAALRSAPIGGVTAANAGGFLEARVHAAQFAADALRQLDTTGVDARVVALGGQLAGWYDEGRTVAEMGQQLLSGASVQERQGSPGKRYQEAEHSHAKRVNAINAEGEKTRQAMSRKYRRTFPPLN